MPGKAKPQGILPYVVEVTEHFGQTTARAGLPLVVETMRALGVDRAIEAHMRVRQRGGGYTEVQKVEALVLLLAAGGECFDDIRTLAADEGLCRLLDRQMPSADTLRHFLYEFHDESLIERAKKLRPAGAVAFIPAERELLAGLARVNLALVHAVAARGKGTRATLDHDATIQESHKREALPHYKGGRGHQPASCARRSCSAGTGRRPARSSTSTRSARTSSAPAHLPAAASAPTRPGTGLRSSPTTSSAP